MTLSSRNHARETHDSSCHLQWHQLEWNIEERRRRLPKTALLLLAYCLLKLFYCFWMGHCKSNSTVLLVPGAEWKRVNNRKKTRDRLTNPLQHSTINEKHTHSAVKSFINLPSSACAVKSFINHDFNPIYIAFSYCLRG